MFLPADNSSSLLLWQHTHCTACLSAFHLLQERYNFTAIHHQCDVEDQCPIGNTRVGGDEANLTHCPVSTLHSATRQSLEPEYRALFPGLQDTLFTTSECTEP